MALLYAAKGGNTNSDLYTVNPATGVMTSVGPIGFAVTGLAFDPTTGILYGSTSNNSPSNPRSIITIDPSTGVGTLVGAVGLGSSPIPDICFDSSGQMYGWALGPTELVTINKATGAATRVGASGIDPLLNEFGFGLDFVSGVLLTGPVGGPSSLSTGLGSYGTLFSLNTGTGAATPVVLMSGWAANDGPSVAAASTDDSGVLWAIFNQFPVCSLVTIDTATGVVTTIGSVGAMLNGSDALAWRPPANDFTVSLTPDSLTICRGFDDTTTLSTTISAGVAQSITLSSTGDPTDVTVAFSANPINSGDSATVTVTVGAGATPGIYTITIHCVGADATHTVNLELTIPGPVDDAYGIVGDHANAIAAPGVLGNDIDPTTASLNTGPGNGTLVLHANGSFVYTPNTGFSGVDTFIYDGHCGSAVVTLTVAFAIAAGVFDGAPNHQAVA